jgi:hypothetical protein
LIHGYVLYGAPAFIQQDQAQKNKNIGRSKQTPWCQGPHCIFFWLNKPNPATGPWPLAKANAFILVWGSLNL